MQLEWKKVRVKHFIGNNLEKPMRRREDSIRIDLKEIYVKTRNWN